MTLATLKTKLSVTAGTLIAEVLFDRNEYLNEKRAKSYPLILWSLNNARFEKDARTATIQKVKTFTFSVMAVINFNPATQDKITVWDTLEGYFDTYINKMNDTAGVQVASIDHMKGEYLEDSTISADRELAIIFTDVEIKTFCT